MKVVVLGSLNIDFVVRTQRLPEPGETILGENFTTSAGGKGANQAVAAARLGASTKMIGRVGRDVFGDMLLDSLRSDGVDISAVAIDGETETGTALITVADDGRNSIVVVPGANATVGRTELDALKSVIEGADVLLLQLEIPIEVVETAASIAASKEVAVILDPAPARSLPDRLLRHCTWITPNEREAEILTGVVVTDQDSVAEAARRLLTMGSKYVVITLGPRGCYCVLSRRVLRTGAASRGYRHGWCRRCLQRRPRGWPGAKSSNKGAPGGGLCGRGRSLGSQGSPAQDLLTSAICMYKLH